MAFFRDNKNSYGTEAAFQDVHTHEYVAPEQQHANLYDGVELVDGQLAVWYKNTLYAVEGDGTDPNIFGFVSAHAGDNDDYYLYANNGDVYPVSPTVFGIVTGSVAPNDNDNDPYSALFAEGQGRTGRKITSQLTLETNAEHPDDFADAGMMGLAHLAAAGAIAQQSLNARLAAAQQMAVEPYAPAYQDFHRQQIEAARQANSYASPVKATAPPSHGSVEVYYGDDYQQYDAAPSTLADELWGEETPNAAPAEAALAPQEDVSWEDVEEVPKKRRREKTPSSLAARLGRGALKLAVEGLVVTAVAVPATHTAVQYLGSKIPFVKVDQNDPMAFNKDLGHDLSMIWQGPKEFASTVTGLIGKVTP